MKKIILLSLLGFLSVACKKSADNSNDTKIEDSINRVREQEVINLNVDDSKLFDTIVQDVK